MGWGDSSVEVVPGLGAGAPHRSLDLGARKTLRECCWQQRGGEEGAWPGVKERVGEFLFP